MGMDSGIDERQVRVFKSLGDRSPKLAGMYRSALNMLRTEPDADCEAARVSMVCHCMRELMAGLPSVMADSSIPRPKPSSSSLLSNLPDLLGKHPDLDLELEQDIVPIPKKVAREFSLLVATVTQESGRNRSNAAALVTGGSDTQHPAIKQWLDAYRFFVRWAHLDRDPEEGRQLPADVELAEVIKVVEDVIEVRTAAFFVSLHSVEDLLASANEHSGEDD